MLKISINVLTAVPVKNTNVKKYTNTNYIYMKVIEVLRELIVK